MSSIPIKRVPVDSQALREVGHQMGVLEVQFHASGCPKLKDKGLACQCLGGAVHQYSATPEEHAALMSAESIGKHFHGNFKSRKYAGMFDR